MIVAAAFVLTSCGSGERSPVAVERRLDGEQLPPVTVRVLLQPEHVRMSARYLDAATESLRVLAVWSLVDPAWIDGRLTLVDPPWRSDAAPDGAIGLDPTAWWTTPTSMASELAVARPLANHALAAAFDARSLPPWFVRGLGEYIARQIVSGLFARENNAPGYAFFEARYFGGFVPRFIRIRLLPDGNRLSVRRVPLDNGLTDRALETDGRAVNTTLLFFALDRWVSGPVLDEIVVEFVRAFRGRQPTISDFMKIASAVSGQDLSWLFVQALDGSSVFDYGIAGITSERSASGAFDSKVTVARYGDGLFTGATTPRVGRFESGRGVTIVVSFADGEIVREAWDGRDERRTFEYRSAAPAVSAIVDPDRLIALDVRRINNSRTLDPRTAIASRRWAARWVAWLEHLLLTYAALV